MKRFLLVLGVVALALAISGSSDARPGGRLDSVVTTGRLAMPMIFGDRMVTMNPDGSGAAVISYAFDTDPAWSPDGTALAVTSSHTGDLFILSPDGQQRRQLTTSDDRESDASWAPSGYEIAYERRHYGDSGIYTIDSDGSDDRLIADVPGCDEDPSFSPDGRQIAFASCRSGYAQIYVMNADGSDVTRVTHDDGIDADPAWSPDGSRIAFESFRGDRRIYTIRPDGSDEVEVTIGPTDFSPAWSPEGRLIAYYAGSREAVVLTTPSGSGDIVVGNGVGSPAWQPIQSDSRCTYAGTEANDVVIGGVDSDVVCGQVGDDHLNGGPGADVIRGGDGADIIDARDGDPDVVDGGPGVDRAMVDRSDRVLNVEDAVYPEPRNVARGRPVSASYWWADSPPEFAVDGLGATGLWWGSYYAPQWIEINLGHPMTIRSIELMYAQRSPDPTVHVIRGRDHAGNLHLLKVVAKVTSDNMVVRIKPKRPWHGIEAVRVAAVEHPGWVAFKEIRVLR